jgi:hypothetical protein
MVEKADEAALVKRWRKGQLAAAVRKRELARAEGPNPPQAVSEALAAYEALRRSGVALNQRDQISERGVIEVRRRWVRIQKHAQALR